MRATRRRTPTLTAGLAALLAAWACLPAISAGQPSLGASCAHPYTATFKTGQRQPLGGDQSRVSISFSTEHPWGIEWAVRQPGYVICTARVQLRDGSWVGPTKVNPYATPTPTGGEYHEPSGARSSLRQVIVTAARTSLRPGANCNYPVFSGSAVDGGTSQKSDTKDFTVNFKLDSRSGPKAGGGETVTFQAEVIIHNPRLVMCRLEVSEFKGSWRTFPLQIGPHGGLSSEIILPSDIGFAIFGYARVK